MSMFPTRQIHVKGEYMQRYGTCSIVMCRPLTSISEIKPYWVLSKMLTKPKVLGSGI